jgi:preprotein translocase subunit SecE
MFNKIKLYFQGVVTESKKIAWPSRQTVINHTFSVIAVVIAATIIFGAIDFGLSQILEKFIIAR